LTFYEIIKFGDSKKNKLNPLTLPLSPANGGEGRGKGGRIKKEIPIQLN